MLKCVFFLRRRDNTIHVILFFAVMLKNYQKAPMSFIVTFSPFDEEDEENTQAFYEKRDPIKGKKFIWGKFF